MGTWDKAKKVGKTGAAIGGLAFGVYGSAAPPVKPNVSASRTGSYSVGQRRTSQRVNTTRPRYTLGDAIIGKKPPRSKSW
ncbi:hypothetical protein D1871_04755 [Nakamurella silvestris]|nr:hypothetical protein D1871_04755 [Nakamurella silvestris]